MPYTARPTLLLPLDWSTILSGRFRYEPGDVQIGFGLESFDTTQQDVVHGLDLPFTLHNLNQIAAFDSLFQVCTGPLKGFWVGSNADDLRIKSGVSATVFRAWFCDLAATLNDHPAQCLLFTKDGATPMAAWIKTVTIEDATTEEITLDDILPQTPDATWHVSRLLYVRLGGDELEFEFLAEQYARVKLRVIELPREYADVDIGLQPIFLYHFSQDFGGGSVQHWYLTSWESGVTSNAQLYTAVAITHQQITDNLKLSNDGLRIDSLYGEETPLDLFVPFTAERPVEVEVFETTLAAPNTTTLIFTGEIASVEATGKRLLAQCDGLGSSLDRQVPRFLIQPRCNYAIGDANCGFDLTTKKVTGTIDSISANKRAIRVTSADILSQGLTDAYDVTLNLPLSGAVATDAIVLYPGDDGRWQTCHDKFWGAAWPDHFGGHPYVPSENPSIKAIERKETAGGKK